MKAVPLFNRVLVKVVENATTTPGGIIIPDAVKEKPQEGVVVSTATECKFVMVGDRVLFSKYAGSEVMVGEESLLIMHEEDIMARYEAE